MCSLVMGKNYGGVVGVTRTIIVSLSKPIRDVLYAPGNKFPTSCPIHPVKKYSHNFIYL